MMEFLNPELYKRFVEYGIKKIERDKIVKMDPVKRTQEKKST